MTTFRAPLIFICSVLSCYGFPGSSYFQEPSVKLTKAVYFRKVTHSYAYDTSAKLIFKVALPGSVHMHNSSVNPTLGMVLNATEFLDMDFKEYIGTFKKTIRSKRQAVVALVAAAAGALVDSVFSPFSHKASGTDHEARKYINKLRNSMMAMQKHNLLFEHDVDSLTQNVSRRAKDVMIELGYTDKTARALLHLTELNNYYVKVMQGLNTCLDRRFPFSIIPPHILESTLLAMIPNLTSAGYQLAFQTHEVGNFEKARLADCFVTKDYVYVLVNVPIKKYNWGLYEMVPIPFANGNKTCTLTPANREIIAVSRDDVVIIESQVSRFCDLIHDILCLVPKFSYPSPHSNRCVQSLYRATNVEAVTQQCKYECANSMELQIHSIERSTIIATHAKQIKVVCPDAKFQYDQTRMKTPDVGTWEINIKCNCSYTVDHHELDTSTFCFNTTFTDSDVKIAIPAFLMQSSYTSDLINTGWKGSHMHLELLPEVTIPKPLTIYGVEYQDIWLGGLSFSVLFLIVGVCIFWRCYFK